MFCLLEFKKFLQRKSNSMYNFDRPVIMKVCTKLLKSPVILYLLFHRVCSPDGEEVL